MSKKCCFSEEEIISFFWQDLGCKILHLFVVISCLFWMVYICYLLFYKWLILSFSREVYQDCSLQFTLSWEVYSWSYYSCNPTFISDDLVPLNYDRYK